MTTPAQYKDIVMELNTVISCCIFTDSYIISLRATECDLL